MRRPPGEAHDGHHKDVVLVVEDEPLIRMGLVADLEHAGYAVLEAANADEALSVLETEIGIATLITDIEMPGSMNGLGLARSVSQRWPDLDIVVMSGRFSPGPDELPEGAQFLSKPAPPDAITATLERFAD